MQPILRASKECAPVFTIIRATPIINAAFNKAITGEICDFASTQTRSNNLTKTFKILFQNHNFILTAELYQDNFDENKEITVQGVHSDPSYPYLIRFAFKNAIHQTYIAPIIDCLQSPYTCNAQQLFALQKLHEHLEEFALQKSNEYLNNNKNLTDKKNSFNNFNCKYKQFKKIFFPNPQSTTSCMPGLNPIYTNTYLKKLDNISLQKITSTQISAINLLKNCCIELEIEVNECFKLALIKNHPDDYQTGLNEIVKILHLDEAGKKTCQSKLFDYLFKKAAKDSQFFKNHASLFLAGIEAQIPHYQGSGQVSITLADKTIIKVAYPLAQMHTILNQAKINPDQALDSLYQIIKVAAQASLVTGFLNLAKPGHIHHSFYYVIKLADNYANFINETRLFLDFKSSR